MIGGGASHVTPGGLVKYGEFGTMGSQFLLKSQQSEPQFDDFNGLTRNCVFLSC